MPPKVSAFCTISLLLLFLALTLAGRPEPQYSDISSLVKTQHKVKEFQAEESDYEGAGEEECLIRRTLAAHIDYVYTQKSNP
ncbi:hypothetical protein SLEP1_g35803 [Rubroshorea leprosula]|uniref:Phytosulfokine n=1 Tax=Rubroshorea leprosula TaxID=152421 RepID=A0AAV5KPG5_9ROSI|nr:hypothetical protein SLEP1_g35803 [Rubroshorea leprosula]